MENISIEQIKDLLARQSIPMIKDIISECEIETYKGEKVACELHTGWDVAKSFACDQQWGPYNLRLAEFIENQNYSKEELNLVLSQVQLDDEHWDWFSKSAHYIGDEYHWFFLMAEGKQQAACLIFHPKKSVITTKDIFYIEFLAVAPWNRDNPMEQRWGKKIGSIMLKLIIKHFAENLKFGYEFSLHSLPKAAGFYQRIGMQYINDHDKGPLKYFEMLEVNSVEFLSAS